MKRKRPFWTEESLERAKERAKRRIEWERGRVWGIKTMPDWAREYDPCGEQWFYEDQF